MLMHRESDGDRALERVASWPEVIGKVRRAKRCALRDHTAADMDATAAGTIAPRVATTDPTVAPIPVRTSGIDATW
jgi:hypothetical protein